MRRSGVQIFPGAFLIQKMRINFFEEFPTKENLRKLSLVDFPTTVYAAARNIKEFERIKRDCSKYMYVQEVAYWPVLKPEEGYWFSAFSSTEGIERTIKELTKNERPLTVLWDAELPMLKKPLMISNIKSFFRNKKLILDFLKNAPNYNIKIATAEYPIKNKLMNKLFKMSAVKFGQNDFKHDKILMAYSSLMKNISINGHIALFRKLFKSFQLGIGLTAAGIQGNEPLMSDEQLERDLKEASSSGIKEIVIFRLGGLNKQNIKIIKKYV